MSERLKNHNSSVGTQERLQFRVDNPEGSSSLHSYISVDIGFSPASFSPGEEEQTLLAKYFQVKGIQRTFEEGDLKEFLLQSILTRERSGGKGKFSVYSPQLIEQIWNDTEKEEEYPDSFLNTETEILLLAALLDSNPEAKSRQLLRRHMERLGISSEDDIAVLAQGVSILENERRVQEKAQKNLADNPELVRENLRYETIYRDPAGAITEFAGMVVELSAREKRALAKEGKKLGFVPFDRSHVTKDQGIVQWNSQQTALFAELLKEARAQAEHTDKQKIVRYLALLHDVDISAQAFDEQKAALLTTLHETPNDELVNLGHSRIAFLLSLGMELVSRSGGKVTEEEQFIVEKVKQLETMGFTFVHESMDDGTCHFTNKIHGALRIENGKAVRDLCPSHTPIQVEEMKVEMRSIVEAVMLRNEQYLKQREAAEKKPHDTPQAPLAGEEAFLKSKTEISPGPLYPTDNLPSVGISPPKRDRGLVMPGMVPGDQIGRGQTRLADDSTTKKEMYGSKDAGEPFGILLQESVDRGVIPLQALRFVARNSVRSYLRTRYSRESGIFTGVYARGLETASGLGVTKFPGNNPQTERVFVSASSQRRSNRPVVSLKEALRILDSRKTSSNAAFIDPLPVDFVLASEFFASPVIPEFTPQSFTGSDTGDGAGLALEVPKVASTMQVLGKGGGGLVREVSKIQSRVTLGKGGGGLVREVSSVESRMVSQGKERESVARSVGDVSTSRIQRSDKTAVFINTQVPGERSARVASGVVRKEQEKASHIIVQAESGTYEKGRNDQKPVQKHAATSPSSRTSPSLGIVIEEKPKNVQQFKRFEPQPAGRLRASSVISFDPYAYWYAGRQALRQVA
jgi:hypothetical protein